MTADARASGTERDPVAAAVADPAVGARLIAAARALLGRRAHSLPATQRSAEAEEIVSEAAKRALQRRDRFDPTRHVVTWLVGFVSNVARDGAKRHPGDVTGPPWDAPRLEDLGRPVEDAV
jgi:DNA-directed RNA polymerase specialized sigma24 family protein